MALRQSQAFPSYVADMVTVGESSGNLEELLDTVSVYYDTRAKQKIATLTAMVGPLIIVAMGARHRIHSRLDSAALVRDEQNSYERIGKHDTEYGRKRKMVLPSSS